VTNANVHSYYLTAGGTAVKFGTLNALRGRDGLYAPSNVPPRTRDSIVLEVAVSSSGICDLPSAFLVSFCDASL